MQALAGPAPPSRDSLDSRLPRRVLRHLVVAHGLGIGSRAVVGGDESRTIAGLFTRLGIDTQTAEVAPLAAGDHDAAVWLDLDPAPAGERSLLSPAALGRTASLLAAVRPGGFFLYVCRTRTSDGHGPSCLGRHLAPFPGRTRIETFADRCWAGLLRDGRSGFAVASWQSPGTPVEPRHWRRAATEAGSLACCAWAGAASHRRKAA